jgi:phenylpropionate dioxygenase-like ring-hydroxylating dioxygenase large terminal subunit
MSIRAEERDIIRELLHHVEHKSTEMLPEVGLNPTSNYTDPLKLQREIDVLFREFPIAIAHRSDLAAPGDFLTHDDTGVPILVTRTESGAVKAYLNVCRHRGARIEDEPCGHSLRFTCPYHAWTYDLDGALRGMPQPVGFDAVDRNERGLVELPAYETHGLIWVVPSPQADDIDMAAWLTPFDEQFSDLDLGGHVVFEKWALHRNMSWRLALEGFQESYHFCSAHRESACSNYLDNQSVWADYGPHVRHSVPLPSLVDLREVPEGEWEYRRHFITQNFVFPANFVQAMTDHVYVHTIIPTGPGTCVFQCMMLVPEAPVTKKIAQYWRANYDVVRRVFDEDFAIGEGIQRNFDAGVNDSFVFGRYECGLHFGQRSIDAALAGEIAPPRR